jgi:hypothetical protein
LEYGQRRKKKLSAALFFAAAAVLLVSLLFACGREDSPEKQIEKLVAAGKEAVEARKPGELKELIAEHYGDDHGRTRRDIVALAARYLYANKNIHLFTRIGELTFSGPDTARLRIYAAMAGQNVSDLDALLNMRADLYLFDLDLGRKDGEWLVVRADWRPAGWEEFF